MFSTLAFGTFTEAGCRGGRLTSESASGSVAVLRNTLRTRWLVLPTS